MNSNFRRLIWAFFLSGSCFLATFLWSNAQKKRSSIEGKEKIAEVTYISEDSKKKLAQSLQWLPISTGDTLFDGDSIRTSDKSEVKISFEDGRSILVDAGSTIVIQKTKGEIALDLVEGSLYVDAKQTSANLAEDKDKSKTKNEIVFKSDKSKFTLDGSKTVLTKNKGQQAQVNILEGQGKFNDSSGQTKELTKGQSVTLTNQGIQNNIDIKIISPSLTKGQDQLSQIYYINPEGDSTVRFKWKGFPKNQEVVLLTGSSKKTMTEKEVVAPGRDSANTLLNLGTHYWQLVSRDPGTKAKMHSSTVYKIDVLSRYPAIVLAPENNKIYESEAPTQNVTLQWQKPQDYKSIKLELSSHPQLLEQFMVLKNINVSQVQEYLVKDLKEGDYYWRLSTKYEDSDTAFQTKIQKFTVKHLIKEPPKPPPVLSWSKTQDKQFYLNQPSIDLSWEALTRKEDITNWKIELVGQNNESVLKQQVQATSLKSNITGPGKFIAYIEALDKNGASLGKLPPKTIDVTEFPLPKAPVLTNAEMKRNAKTNKIYFENGVVQLQWNYQQVVKEYEVELNSSLEGENQKITLGKNNLEYKGKSGTGLTPGQYQLKITPIDQHNRRGPSSESFEFEVPKSTSLSAPKLKNLNIKQNSE